MALVDPFMPQKRPTVFRAKKAEQQARQRKEPRPPQLVKYRPDVSGHIKRAITDYRATEVRQPAPWTLPEHGAAGNKKEEIGNMNGLQGSQTRPDTRTSNVVSPQPVPRPQPVLDLRNATPRPASPVIPAKAGIHPQSSSTAAQHALPATRPALQNQPQTPVAKKTFNAPVKRQPRFKAFVQTTAVIIWALAMGLGIYSQTIGEFALLLYAFVALVFRLSSQFSFGLALCAFAGIIVAQIVKPNSSIAGNIAVYAFLLLAIGALSLGLEIRQQGRWSRRPRPGKRRK